MNEKKENMKFTKKAKQVALGHIRKEYQFTFISDGTGIECPIYGAYISLINLFGDDQDYKVLNETIEEYEYSLAS